MNKNGYQGISARDVGRLGAFARRIGLPDYGDIYSCVVRPGSWEWQTENAAKLRGQLEAWGYAEEPDPDVDYRVRWRRS